MLPLDLLLIVVAMAVAALGLLIGLLGVPFDRRLRMSRLCAFGISYLTMEIAVLGAAAYLWLRHLPRLLTRAGSRERWIADHEALLAWALTRVLASARRWVHFRVFVDTASEPAALTQPEPILVLARHGGLGDSFALVHMLLTRYGRHIRVVLKDVLQFDPALDVLLNRLDCYFLPSSSGAGEDLSERLAEFAVELGAGEALLVFPEGGNWTPSRRRRAIWRLQRDGRAEAATAAGLMEHVLPPRPGGVLACVAARPETPIVIIAHAGLDAIVNPGLLWAALPLDDAMVIRSWGATTPPTDPNDQLAWLTTEWAIVDEWIDAYHAGDLRISRELAGSERQGAVHDGT